MNKKTMIWGSLGLLLVSLWFIPAVRSQVISGAQALIDAAGNMMVSLGTLISGEDSTNDALMVEGADVRQSTVMSAITTNTTTPAIVLPTGNKTLYGQVVCSSGACTQTQAVYGDVDEDSANGVLLCTLTLSGTTRAQNACPVITANFSFYYVTTTDTTGTAASGAMYSMH